LRASGRCVARVDALRECRSPSVVRRRAGWGGRGALRARPSDRRRLAACFDPGDGSPALSVVRRRSRCRPWPQGRAPFSGARSRSKAGPGSSCLRGDRSPWIDRAIHRESTRPAETPRGERAFRGLERAAPRPGPAQGARFCGAATLPGRRVRGRRSAGERGSGFGPLDGAGPNRVRPGTEQP
jgi:hypothetical protein